MQNNDAKIKGIAKLLRLAKSEAELMQLIPELLTDSEIEKVHERIKIVECLSDGLSQRETVKKSGAAIATVTRGASLLKKPKLVLAGLIHKAQTLSWWRSLIWRA